MRKRMMLVGILVVLAAAVSSNAYAEGGTTAWQGFWDSFGGFLYNALPWNWHNWAGK